MASKRLVFAVASLLLAYYVYVPLPENVEEKWKITMLDLLTRTFVNVAELSDLVGIKSYMEVWKMGTSTMNVPPISDENVTVTDTTFNNVPVRLFVPVKASKTAKRAVIYFHGGGWCILSSAAQPYDLLSRWTANKLNAVVVSVDYRLAPEHHFPAAFEDVYAVSKYFLQKEILAQYNVDPGRICVAGDSAGGNLAAAVTQQLQVDPDVKIKPKIQALVYPALQSVDLDTPSYRDNRKMPFLTTRAIAWFWNEYFASDGALLEAMLSNTHVTSEDNHLINFANWSNLLPEELKKGHVYSSPRPGRSEFVKKYPAIVDPRASPLLVDDAKLSKLPLTYIISSMYDPLRDDAFMYATRLRKVGVQVIHDHYDSAFHGMLTLSTGLLDLSLGQRMVNDYFNRLNENL